MQVIQIVLWYLESDCSKHMIGDRSQLTNFINKFLGVVKFGNDHVAKIMGYGDYHIRNVTISRVYYVEGLGYSLFFVGQFCDSKPKVAFRQHNSYIHNLEEAVAIACYTYNRSIIRLCHGKTPYELLHDKLPDLLFFHVFGALCYLINDSENLGKLQPKANIAPEVIALIAKVVASEPVASTGSHSLTTVDQDAPSPSNSQTTPKTQSPVISNDVKDENHDLNVSHINNDPFFGILIPKNDSESSSLNVIPTVVHYTAPNSEHVTKLTNDHPLDNIIGELERHVSTRLQLHKQALFCYYDAFLTSVEPKNYKDTLTQACWIEAMQEELNEFKRFQVWELVPHPDK
nr:Gag-Pol polyprotein [Tanacetum cinerariifolium]